MSITRFLTLLSLTAVTIFTPLHYAHAYLDGGTGSYIIQIAIGLIVSGGYLLRTMGGRITHFFKNRKSTKNTSDTTND